MNNPFHDLDEASSNLIHCCLESRLPALNQKLLELLGIEAGRIAELRAGWAARAGVTPAFRARHEQHVIALEFTANADQVFPLLCPVRENEWIAGWQQACTLLHSHSGVAENGCVFTTFNPTEGRAVWICSDHSKDERRIEYIKHIEGLVIAKWQMRVESLAPGLCALVSRYALTGLSEPGNAHVARFFETGHAALLEGLRAKILHYLGMGEMLKPA